uniref:Transposase InsH N-terminal domain-containing protein n=1 Tax=uncultured prokaryote TaxID=198431 RepID=A0A0H5QCL4_9ZZZZ|nr:hypothetical protein [uncultured prokaryote]
MQTRYSNINDLFSGTGCYPLENLSKDNRWVKLADSLDWDYIEVEYNKRLKNQKVGAGNKPARMVVGALIIKHMLGSSDDIERRNIGAQKVSSEALLLRGF